MTAVIVMLVTLAMAGHPATQATESDVNAFATSSTAVKLQTLHKLTTQRVEMAPESLVALLRVGLQDGDPSVREGALLAIVSRAGGPRFSRTAETVARWHADHAAIQTLRDDVMRATNDEQPKVRHAAVLALGNLGYREGKAGAEALLPDATLVTLEQMYRKDADPRVRTEIVKTFALCDNTGNRVRDVLLSAFDDATPGVRQFAAAGASRLRTPEFVPKLLVAVKDQNETVRVAAAQALQAHAGSLKTRLGELQSLYDNEASPKVRHQLEIAIRGVRQQQPR